MKSIPHYYRGILLNWKRYLLQKAEVPSCILPQNLCYNQYIQIDKEPVHLVKFSDKNINTAPHLYDSNNFFVHKDIVKERHKLQEETYFQWV